MNITPDDPILTAYALGELDDGTRAEVEAFLEGNEAARLEVEGIRETIALLTAEFAAETEEVSGLTGEQRAALLAEAEKAEGTPNITPLPVRPRIWLRYALAASLLLCVGAVFVLPALTRARESARRQEFPVARQEVLPKGDLPEATPSAPQSAVAVQPPVALEKKQENEGAVSAQAAPAAPTAVTADEKDDAGTAQPAQEPVPTPPAPAAPVDEWAEVGVKTMSQQSVIGLPEEAPAPPPAVQSAAAEAPKPEKAKEAPGINVGADAPPAPAPAGQVVEQRTRLNVKADFTDNVGKFTELPPAEAREQLKNLGYATNADGVSAQAGAAPAKKAEPAAGGGVNLYWNQPVVPDREAYTPVTENAFQRVADAPLSTFSIDVDTASYANMRRFLGQGTLPPADAVRIEELINYFKYDYPAPQGDAPFAVAVDMHPCPWNPGHFLARIGLRGKELPAQERPAANLVFLVDVSGSMSDGDKLPLLKQGMKLLARSLDGRDRISIVTYAGNAGVQLQPTPGDNQATILRILDGLRAGGSTNGAGGIQMAYDLARRSFIQGGVNRVILATDGDFNVGVSDTDALVGMIQREAQSGVFLSVLGFGRGNLQDGRMEALADKGNGNYAYIDSFEEARRVLLDQASATLFTIAKDVKIQVEFNPSRVGAYRLIGYENRALAAQDFNDDRKDAGEVGAGHTVTALYEITPPGVVPAPPQVDSLKYQTTPQSAEAAKPAGDAPAAGEWMTVKLRYKHPDGSASSKLELPVPAGVVEAPVAPDYQFAASVAAFGMLLRRSAHSGSATMDQVIELARRGRGADPDGARAEFIGLVKTAAALMGPVAVPQPAPMVE